tara:strand:- start:2724 stop:3488 length:765 start_codon:yes stop_codon:yes gene_type:complete
MDIAQLFASMGMVPNTDIVNGQVVVLGQEESTYQTGMQESEYGQGPARFETEIEIAGDKFTEDDLREYVVGLQPDELLTLQQALFSEGYYGTIEDITEIEDPINTGKALRSAARDAAMTFEQGVTPGMEGVPTLEDRFAEFTIEDLNTAKDEYLQTKDPTIRVMPASAVDRMVEDTWKKLLGRKPTAEERRAAFGAVRAAQVAGGNAMQDGGIVESVDVTGIVEGQAEAADPARFGAMSLSGSASALKRVLGLV